MPGAHLWILVCGNRFILPMRAFLMAESTSFSSDVVRSCADLVILTLPMNKAMHGYDTLVSMADVGDGQFRFKQGTLSPLLYRLEREGWIKAKRQTPPKGKKRKIYRITTQGKRIHKSIANRGSNSRDLSMQS
jgi:DNA-binding PadR family transcriptional regulator